MLTIEELRMTKIVFYLDVSGDITGVIGLISRENYPKSCNGAILLVFLIEP